jgi:excisionase family DNA binding protein
MKQSETVNIISTAQAATILGVTRDAVLDMITAKKLTVLQTIPGKRVTYLLDRTEVEQLAAERAAKKQRQDPPEQKRRQSRQD